MKDTVKALNVGISIIMTEHFFTFVRRSYLIAMGLSLVFSGICSYLLADPLGFLTSLALCLIFIWLYERALQGRI